MGEACSSYGEKRNTHLILWGKLKESDHSENFSLDGKIIVKCTLGN